VSNRRPETNRPWIIAHRGASRDRPENTLAAFDEALRQGCDAMELDLRLAADGVPVVCHDENLERLGHGRRRVAELDAAQLREVDAGSWFDKRWAGQHIPTLNEVLQRYGRRVRLLLELKDEGGDARNRQLVGEAASRVREHEIEANVFLLSFSTVILDAAATRAPWARCVLNLFPPPRLGDELRRRLPGLFAVCADVRALTPEFGLGVRSAGRRLWTYTCNDSARVARALEAGAGGMISDRPGWLAAHLDAVDPR
jgi:glycerophosphoryl diester phosphodiesterase